MRQKFRSNTGRAAEEPAAQCVGIGRLDRVSQLRRVAGQDGPDQHRPSITQDQLLLVLRRVAARQRQAVVPGCGVHDSPPR